MKIKTILFVGMVLISISLSVYYSLPKNEIDCNKPFDVVYITHSELPFAQEIANKINGVVVIPEDNQLIARTEILNCPTFDYSNYIKGGF